MLHLSCALVPLLILGSPQSPPGGEGTRPAKEHLELLRPKYNRLLELSERARRYRQDLTKNMPPTGARKLTEQLELTDKEIIKIRGELVAAIRLARRQHPRNADICRYSYQLAYDNGDLKQALRDVDVIIAANPKEEKAANMRALLRFQLGDFAGTLAEITRIRKSAGKPGLYPGLRIRALANLHRWAEIDREARDRITQLQKDDLGINRKVLAQQIKYLSETAAAYRACARDWARESKLRLQEEKGGNNPRVMLDTARGPVLLELFEDQAPNTVANFIRLAESGFYDGTTFHRVEAGFMAQGGDPNTKDSNPRNDGRGGPGWRIADECRYPGARRHYPGSLAMANESRPDTNGSQFYISMDTTYHLDGKHTVFGRVLQGMEQVFALRRGDRIRKVKVLRKRKHDYPVIKLR